MKKVEELEKAIREGEMLKVRTNDRILSLSNQYKETAQELKKLGIDPQNGEVELEKKKKEFENKIKELEALIPIDIINQYKNYDFSGGVEEKEMNMPF